jgi:iron complex transport system substrate-binding protein
MIFKTYIRILLCSSLFIVAILFILPAADALAASFQVESSDVIMDQNGRRLRVTIPFQRIISLYGAHTENLFSLGLGKEIIGVSTHEDYPAEALQRPVFSYHDDPEKFLAARPDLVLIRPMIDRGYPQFISRLEKSGITVVSLQPAAANEIYTYWEILGILTGRQQRAQRLIEHFQHTVERVRTLASAIEVKKKVYFEAIHSKMKTFAPESMAIFALETAGGMNVAQDARPVRKTNIAFYGKERILSHAGEIDAYLAQYGAMNTPSIALIKNEPGFQAIKAVKNNKIYILDERVVSRPTMRLLIGILKIGQILYPEVFDEKAEAILNP